MKKINIIIIAILLTLHLMGVSPIVSTMDLKHLTPTTTICAQNALKIVIQIDTTTSIGRCDGRSHFIVHVENTAGLTLNYDTVNILLGGGIYLDSTNGPDIDTANHINPIFVYASIGPYATDTFSLFEKAYCNPILNGFYTDNIYYSYSDPVLHDSTLIFQYYIQSPTLAPSSSSNMYETAYFGETFTRWMSYKNIGNPPFNGEIEFIDDNGLAVRIDSIWIAQDSIILTDSIFLNTD